jgi:acetaldehyde dehydrogenase (acetylating)
VTTTCAVLGSGNIGTDLMVKLRRSDVLDLTAVVGVDPASDGLRLAREQGIATSTGGAAWIAEHPDRAEIVFDATSAAAHRDHAAILTAAAVHCIDLTPAKLGPGIVPVVNLEALRTEPDVNLISCGGQATIPIVHAVSQVTEVRYAEIVSTIASASAGPGTRQNIDEFTDTTARGLEEIGGARRGKAIIVLNPADPPLLMRNTVYCVIDVAADRDAITRSIRDAVDAVAAYVPGYRMTTEPVFDDERVAVFLEVEGAGDYLPAYAGNLDIMTSAAVHVAERLARSRLEPTR